MILNPERFPNCVDFNLRFRCESAVWPRYRRRVVLAGCGAACQLGFAPHPRAAHAMPQRQLGIRFPSALLLFSPRHGMISLARWEEFRILNRIYRGGL